MVHIVLVFSSMESTNLHAWWQTKLFICFDLLYLLFSLIVARPSTVTFCWTVPIPALWQPIVFSTENATVQQNVTVEFNNQGKKQVKKSKQMRWRFVLSIEEKTKTICPSMAVFQWLTCKRIPLQNPRYKVMPSRIFNRHLTANRSCWEKRLTREQKYRVIMPREQLLILNFYYLCRLRHNLLALSETSLQDPELLCILATFMIWYIQSSWQERYTSFHGTCATVH